MQKYKAGDVIEFKFSFLGRLQSVRFSVVQDAFEHTMYLRIMDI